MRNSKNLLLGLATLGTAVLSAQSPAPTDSARAKESTFKTWTIGVRAVHLYDLLSDRFDTPIEQDLQGLTGDNTQFDIGVDAYIEKQFTPLFGMQLGYRGGEMTGSNGTEYYENSFNELSLRGVLIWSNLARNRDQARFNFYTNMGLSYGSYDAQRFLEIGGVENREAIEGQSYWGSYLGLGTQYLINSNWRVELELAYNTVYDDGFDGFNAATGSDAFLSTGIGIAYTFGKKEKPAMHASNYFAEPYQENRESRAAERLAREMRKQDSTLAQEAEATRQEVQRLRGEVQSAQQVTDKRLAGLEAEDGKPVTIDNVVYIFFDLESASLSAEAKKAILQAYYQKEQPLRVVGYADQTGTAEYNARLKQARAEAVKDFMVNVLGYDVSKITVATGETQDADGNLFLSRRVEIHAQD